MEHTREELFYKNGKAKKSLCLCLSREKRAELKRLHGRDIIQCAGNSCPYYSVECGRENIERFEKEKRDRQKFRLDSVPDINKEKQEEALASEYCKDPQGRSCDICPYNRSRRKDDKCYEFWKTHNPLSADYKEHNNES